MSIIEAIILGIIQGLTEFLPVSSSGHIELGKALLGLDVEEDLMFTSVVHAATVLSIIIVFRKEIANIFVGLFDFKWNAATIYVTKIIVSMLPVVIIGLFFKPYVEAIFNTANILLLVGCMLIITALLLAFAYYTKSHDKNISFKHAFIIGLAQMCAILPGISRSGATIATGLLLKNNREKITQFSFLMVIIPILGENILSMAKGDFHLQNSIGLLPLLAGFLSAFFAGLFACKLMIRIVKSGKLIYFAGYCAIVGVVAIISFLI